MTRSTIAALLAAAMLTPWAASAQSSSQDTAQTSTREQNPPAAVGEEGAKETRGFFSALAHNLGDDLKHMPRKNSLYWLAGGGAAALAIHPEDSDINGRLVNKTTDGLWKPGHVIGSTELILAGSATAYLIGRHTHATRVQHLGMDELEATILSEAFTQGLKLAVRRERPQEIGTDTQARTYSFPSGHSMLTFAAATVLQQHLGYRAAIPTYAVATYVAMSRLHDNRHYASDVIFGSAMGIVIGRSVTWHGRNFYASPMLLPGGGGIQLALAR